MRTGIPFKSLASFYFCYFAAVGALMPYLGLFLVERGCSPAQVGSVNALLAVMRICTPYLWGALADRTQRRMRVVQRALFAASMCIGALWLVTDFRSIALWLILYGVFINGTLAQFEIVTFRHLAERQAHFPRVRLWASVGFLLAVLAMGPLFDRVSVLTLPLWVAGTYLVCWGFGTRIREPQHTPNQRATGDLMSVLRRRPVQALLLVGLLVQLSCGPFNAFFSIYVGEHGYSRTTTGLLWAIGYGVEIALLHFAPWLQGRFGLRQLLLASLATLSLRWLLQTLWIDNVGLLLIVQSMQGLSVGVGAVVFVALVQQMFPDNLQGRGQAIFVALSNGVGTAIGSLLSGLFWHVQPKQWLWFAASAVALVAWAVAWRWLRVASADNAAVSALTRATPPRR